MRKTDDAAPRPRSRRERDWDKGVLLIAAIIGVPILVAALVQFLAN